MNYRREKWSLILMGVILPLVFTGTAAGSAYLLGIFYYPSAETLSPVGYVTDAKNVFEDESFWHKFFSSTYIGDPWRGFAWGLVGGLGLGTLIYRIDIRNLERNARNRLLPKSERRKLIYSIHSFNRALFVLAAAMLVIVVPYWCGWAFKPAINVMPAGTLPWIT